MGSNLQKGQATLVLIASMCGVYEKLYPSDILGSFRDQVFGGPLFDILYFMIFIVERREEMSTQRVNNLEEAVIL